MKIESFKAGWFALLVVVLTGCDRRSLDAENANSGSRAVPVPTQLVPLTNMVPIKAGMFIRFGQPVTITRDYWLGRFEVTQAEYNAVTGQSPSHFKDDPSRPVEKVSFFDAAAYCTRLTERERQADRLPPDYEYRLPTEAEWEYACRAGTTNLFSFGDSTTDADKYAWTAENSEEMTHPVGQKLPNPWGLYDMHGNVWEWCLDWFANYPATALTDPIGAPSGKYKVFRGGSWYHDVEYARSRNRFMMEPGNGINFVGFRVALAPVRR